MAERASDTLEKETDTEKKKDDAFSVKYSGNAVPSTYVKKEYDKELVKMANDWQINTEVITCHGDASNIPPEMDFDKFYIFAQMAPDVIKTKKSKIKELTMGGKKYAITGGQQDILEIEGEIPAGMNVIKDETGINIAIVYDSSLYFLSDFIHCHNNEELATSLATFMWVVNEATKTPDLMKALKSGAEEKGKRILENVLQKLFKASLKKEQLQLESSIKLVNEYMTNLVTAQRKILSTQAIIGAIQKNILDVPTALEKKWNSTKKLAGTSLYETISFQRSCVKGVTTPIFVKESGTWYNLGKFEVVLSFDGNVKIHSLFEKRGPAQDHPHVSGGTPCWGNMSGELPKRLAESEFDVAFVEVHTFLSHYSREGGPYATIDKWPAVTDKSKIEELESRNPKALKK